MCCFYMLHNIILSQKDTPNTNICLGRSVLAVSLYVLNGTWKIEFCLDYSIIRWHWTSELNIEQSNSLYEKPNFLNNTYWLICNWLPSHKIKCVYSKDTHIKMYKINNSWTINDSYIYWWLLKGGKCFVFYWLYICK